MSIHAADKNLQIENVVVNYRDRKSGSNSKLKTVPDGLRVIKMIHRLFRYYRPSMYFGIIAFILFALSVGFLIPVMIEYKNTGMVERFPTLIVCGFTMIAALLSFFSGQILNTIHQKNRQDFEMTLCRVTGEFQSKKQEGGSQE